MQIVWDEPKRELNHQVHGLDFADAHERFEWNDALIENTYPGKNGARLKATGFLDGDLVVLVFSRLGAQALSFISLRRANRTERKRYDES
jgi:hypothetical protein